VRCEVILKLRSRVEDANAKTGSAFWGRVIVEEDE